MFLCSWLEDSLAKNSVLRKTVQCLGRMILNIQFAGRGARCGKFLDDADHNGRVEKSMQTMILTVKWCLAVLSFLRSIIEFRASSIIGEWLAETKTRKNRPCLICCKYTSDSSF